MIATLSSLGLPLLNGFIGEFTILSGIYQVSLRFAAWAVIGIVLGAAYLLWLYQRVMFGPVTNPANEHLPDLNAREYATLIPLVLLAFWIGIYPKPLFTVLEAPVHQIVEQVNPGYYNAASPASPATAVAAAPARAVLPEVAPAKGQTGIPAEPVSGAAKKTERTKRVVIASASIPASLSTTASTTGADATPLEKR
jgi:NADH-quinone oxidoreductase subunit M